MTLETDDDLGRILDDLFFEQDTEVLATNYRHGVLRTLAVLGRTLLFSRAAVQPSIESNTCVAVTFFANEHAAARRTHARLPQIDRVLDLDVHALSLVRQQLGWAALVTESFRFVRAALARKGRRYVGRLTYPLLGWLLYCTVRAMLADKSAVAIVTTNMQHPLSIGVAWAAHYSGQTSVFVEHATTPRLVFKDRGYDRYCVAFPHTRQMLIDRGVPAERVDIFEEEPIVRLPSVRVSTGAAGLCVNILDSLHAISDVAGALSRRGWKVILRVHDADLRLLRLRDLATELGADFDSARSSRIDTFFQRVDLVVAGNSNVVGDAIIAGKSVIYYWSGATEMFDYYGLVGHYRIPSARSGAEFDAVLDELVRPDALH